MFAKFFIERPVLANVIAIVIMLLGGAALLLIAALIFGIRHLTRVEGSIGGSGMPRLAWKWSPRRDA